MSFLAACAMIALCVFLILLILIQRGKGGGLAGAFGGMGGQSAFGTKAGDTFMRITIVCSIIWFVFCLGTALIVAPNNKKGSGLGLSSGIESVTPDAGQGSAPPATSSAPAAPATDTPAQP